MKILLGMSGGLDSTYAVVKLREAGFEVEGASVKMHEHTELDEARRTAEALGVPFHVIDARRAFEDSVVSSFINEYKCGRTPNPCVICNSEVKLRALYDYAMARGFDRIATGHYADVCVRNTDGGVRHAIRRSRDLKKDQSYMLWRLSEEILSALVLPLANETKREVREKARASSIDAADRPESQEICFIPDGDYAAFIEGRTGACPSGNFINKEGKILGTHKGIIRYTVGQRKGLGISLGERAFVTEINAENNTVTLDTVDKLYGGFRINGMNFTGICEPEQNAELKLLVKHRYLAPLSECTLIYRGGGVADIRLASPVRAVTPGQSAVLYDGDVVAAGGFITSSEA